ncbi:YbaB/EbfC family nucleoid-associated protein [Micromonospora sp. PLK6-60]|uniref:YbaB/EbfC family nucleoid-associated protein n=1 Tax=Micromonospora sp. PLK6-60 TaxID=2873383 RepID=UPI001CA737BA|nr:YbaB/EbfC family nucleoid-associated protein [Micromonospora sp. PLK6-60]MBY8874453.1 YbaB/EbfC family nucleoid-associated protein [Micromonospora sp. PLK6-60]
MTEPRQGDQAADVMAQMMARMREELRRGDELRSRLAGLTGRAESPDGLVAVTCTADDPAHELHLDPRALRRPSEELAELLQELLREARTDLRRQTDEALRELGGGAGPQSLVHDPAAAQAKLAQLNELVSGPVRDSVQMLERMRRQLGV